MINNQSARSLTAQQKDLYDARYAIESRVPLERYPLDFLDVRLHSIWSLLRHGPTILDMGCGSGSLLLRQRPSRPVRYIGVDIARAGLVKAREITAEYSSGFIQASADDLPLKDDLFDGVFAISVIEHVPDSLKFLNMCARVLKTGGLIVIHTPNPDDRFTVDGFLRRFFPTVYMRRGFAVGHDYARYLAPEVLSQIMTHSGFQVIRLEYTDTLVEWLWVNVLWPTMLALARRLVWPVHRLGATWSQPHLVPSRKLTRAICFYNSVIFPLVRLLCWPDRLIELTGNSGGYVIVGRKSDTLARTIST